MLPLVGAVSGIVLAVSKVPSGSISEISKTLELTGMFLLVVTVRSFKMGASLTAFTEMVTVDKFETSPRLSLAVYCNEVMPFAWSVG